MNLNDLFNEDAMSKVMTPQRQQDLRNQSDYGGEDFDEKDQYGNLKRSTSPGLGGTIDIGGVSIPAAALDAGLGSMGAMGGLRNIGGMKGIFGKSQNLGNTARDIATQRNVGGEAIPSLGQSGKVVTSPAMDKALTKLGGKNVEVTPGPTSKSASTNVQLDPAVDVPTYIRKGLPDPVTVPKPGTKTTIKVKPGETMDQAIQRTKSEQEFGKFLQGQGGQTFGTPTAGAGRGTVNPEPAIPQRFPATKTDKQREWDEFRKEHGFDPVDKIEHDYNKAADVVSKKAMADAKKRGDAQAAREAELGLPPGSLRPRSQWEQERAAALRSEEQKLGLPPGSLSSRSQRQPEQTTTPPGEKENSGIFNYIKNNPKKSTVAAIGAVSAADELLKDKKLKEQSPKKREQPEVNYDDEYDAMVARVKKLAGLGPMKTVYDPNKRQYRNMPTAQQPQKK